MAKRNTPAEIVVGVVAGTVVVGGTTALLLRERKKSSPSASSGSSSTSSGTGSSSSSSSSTSSGTGSSSSSSSSTSSGTGSSSSSSSSGSQSGFPSSGPTGYGGTHPQGTVPSGSIIVGSPVWLDNVSINFSGQSTTHAVVLPIMLACWPSSLAGSFLVLNPTMNGQAAVAQLSNGFTVAPQSDLLAARVYDPSNPTHPWVWYPDVSSWVQANGQGQLVELHWNWGGNAEPQLGHELAPIPYSDPVAYAVFTPNISYPPPSGTTVDVALSIGLAYDAGMTNLLPGFPLNFQLPNLPVAIGQTSDGRSGSTTGYPYGYWPKPQCGDLSASSIPFFAPVYLP